VQIIGYGIEIVETSCIKEHVEQSGERFERQHFTALERNVFESGVCRIHYLAGRFAVKKALLNALGMVWKQETSWLDIEVQRFPNGEPSIMLRAKCKEIASNLGITRWMLSISHTSSYAAANTIALGLRPEYLEYPRPHPTCTIPLFSGEKERENGHP